MRGIDLFAGIGGFTLGLERAGFETVAFCEIDKHAQAILKKHWPDTPCYDDVTKLTAERLVSDGVGEIDFLAAGFPCQDISVAGKLAGIGEGTRSGLWSEVARLIGEFRPRYAIMENVSNLLSGPSEQPGGWFGRVLSDLAALGYDAEWHCIPASYLAASHRRDRVWIIAYPNKVGREGCAAKPIFDQSALSREPLRGFARWSGRSSLPTSRFCRADDGVPQRVHRTERLGNAVVPVIPEIIGKAIMEHEARIRTTAA